MTTGVRNEQPIMVERKMSNVGAFRIKNCYPYIVSNEYLESQPDGGTELVRPIGHGLSVVLVQDHRGVVKNVGLSDLAGAKLTAESAHKEALGNLEELLHAGDIEITGYDSGPNDLPFILVGEHWAAAACILLPAILGIARENLGCSEVIASIPHRDALLLFPKAGRGAIPAIQQFVVEHESEGRKPLTFEPFELTEKGPVPVLKRP